MKDSTRRYLTDLTGSPDWRAAAPGVDLRWLAAVAVAVPLLLAVGVFWLHRLPPGPILRADDNVVQVRLVGPQSNAAVSQDVPQPRPIQQASADSAVDTPARPLPEPAALQDPAPVEPAVLAPTSRLQATAPPMSRAILDQKAATFQRTLLSHIARFRQYPEDAKRNHTQGVVRLLFAMRRDGSVSRMTIATSSGSPVLDSAAVATLRRAEPLPKIPAELPDNLNILFPVAFDLSY